MSRNFKKRLTAGIMDTINSSERLTYCWKKMTDDRREKLSYCFNIVDDLIEELCASGFSILFNDDNVVISISCSTDVVMNDKYHVMYKLLDNVSNFAIHATDEEGSELKFTFVF